MNNKKNFFSKFNFFKKKKNKEKLEKELFKKKTSNFIKNDVFFYLKNCIKNTKKIFFQKIKKIFGVDELNPSVFKKLENLFLSSDFGIQTTNKILNKLKKEISYQNITKPDLAIYLLKKILLEILENKKIYNPNIYHQFPKIILIVGVNGVGKTTTIAKIAYLYQQKGRKVMLVAGDTFRAAAIDQLTELGDSYNIPVFSKFLGSDPASVTFEAMERALSEEIDILLIDTSGRLHNKEHLMQELKKIHNVIQRKNINKVSYEKILVLDANTGQNALQQTKVFHENINVTGIILTKLDGTPKGGIIFALSYQFLIPILYFGTGEKITDLKKFNNKVFIDSIF